MGMTTFSTIKRLTAQSINFLKMNIYWRNSGCCSQLWTNKKVKFSSFPHIEVGSAKQTFFLYKEGFDLFFRLTDFMLPPSSTDEEWKDRKFGFSKMSNQFAKVPSTLFEKAKSVLWLLLNRVEPFNRYKVWQAAIIEEINNPCLRFLIWSTKKIDWQIKCANEERKVVLVE